MAAVALCTSCEGVDLLVENADKTLFTTETQSHREPENIFKNHLDTLSSELILRQSLASVTLCLCGETVLTFGFNRGVQSPRGAESGIWRGFPQLTIVKWGS
jgi:hypothetical protein